MRFLASLLAIGLLGFVGCAGDSSAIMSVWNDSGAAGGPLSGGGQVTAGGGSAGGVTGGLGGSGGQAGNGSVVVVGGIRDVATTQCILTTGGSCPASSDYLTCLEGNCGSNLTACYSPGGTPTSTAAGACLKYANCMLGCSCDAGKSTCEDRCMQNYGTGDPACWPCLIDIGTCMSKFSCPPITSCSFSAGSAGSAGGAIGGSATSGSAGAIAGAGGMTAGTGVAIYPDAGPFPTPAVPDAAPKKDAYLGMDLVPIFSTVDVAPLRGDTGAVARPEVARMRGDLGGLLILP